MELFIQFLQSIEGTIVETYNIALINLGVASSNFILSCITFLMTGYLIYKSKKNG